MVLVTSKTRVGAGEGGIERAFQAQGARHRHSGHTRPGGNRTTRPTLLACVASTPVAVAGRRACAWHQLAGWCHVAFVGLLSAHDAPPRGRCALTRPRW